MYGNWFSIGVAHVDFLTGFWLRGAGASCQTEQIIPLCPMQQGLISRVGSSHQYLTALSNRLRAVSPLRYDVKLFCRKGNM